MGVSGNLTIGPVCYGFAVAYLVLAIPAWLETQPPAHIVLASALLGTALIVLSSIDFYVQRLPDILTLPLAVAGIGLCAAFGWGNLVERSAAAAVAYVSLFVVAALYQMLRGRPGLGLGDAKLFAAAGAWVGFDGLPSVLLFATGSALCFVTACLATGRATTSATRIAFGPFLAFGLWLVWLYGPLK